MLFLVSVASNMTTSARCVPPRTHTGKPAHKSVSLGFNELTPECGGGHIVS